MFDAIAEPDKNWRIFQFVAKWLPNVSYGYVDTRQGHCIRAALLKESAILRGYQAGSPLAKPAADGADKEALSSASPIPASLRRFLKERRFDCGGVTFCIWRIPRGRKWRTLDVMLCSKEVASYPLAFLDILSGCPDAFAKWVREYYERKDLERVITALYDLVPLTGAVVRAIGGGRSWRDIAEAAAIIGYPIGDASS